MKHVHIAWVAMMAALFSAGAATAQYGPEEIGAEESPIVDPDTETDDSNAELQHVEAMDGVDPEAEAASSEDGRKGRGCAIDPASSAPSRAPVAAFLVLLGLVGLGRLRASR